MIVHRIGHKDFIGDMTGIGAKKFGGRWNPEGVACLYCSEHLSLAVMEKFVHAQGKTDMVHLATKSFTLPSGIALYKVDVSKLEKDWKNNIAYTQWLGKQILQDPSYAGFIVPSIIIDIEMNIILNPASKQFARIIPQKEKLFQLDMRLIAKLG